MGASAETSASEAYPQAVDLQIPPKALGASKEDTAEFPPWQLTLSTQDRGCCDQEARLDVGDHPLAVANAGGSGLPAKGEEQPPCRPGGGPGDPEVIPQGAGTTTSRGPGKLRASVRAMQWIRKLHRATVGDADSDMASTLSVESTNAKLWASMFGENNSDLRSGSFVTLEDGERRLVLDGERRIFPPGINSANKGRPNLVKTTRYTPLTWLPKSLMQQFKRVANTYFLFITSLVCILTLHPSFESPKDWKSKVGPFAMVLLWTACKDLYEDRLRSRDDDAVNLAECTCYNHSTQSFERRRWQDVVVGDFLLVSKDEAFPADLILLHPAGGQDAFISTVMLDGETALKGRDAPPMFQVLSSQLRAADPGGWDGAQEVVPVPTRSVPCPPELQPHALGFITQVIRPRLTCYFAKPVQTLEDVRGSLVPKGLSREGDGACPVSSTNFLPRGCVLRNTNWACAVVLFAGKDTKTRLNASDPLPKFSNMQRVLNRCVQGLLCVLFSICISATIAKEAGKGSWAADTDESFIVIFMKYCIKFYHVVPISLYLMSEILKMVLVYHVSNDKALVDPDTNEGAVCRTADLVEEMGQVDFVFSDKTGTLTKNEMVFAQCHVTGKDLGDFRSDGTGHAPGIAAAKALMARGDADPEARAVRRFFTHLAVCHSVQVTKTTLEDGRAMCAYTGMSPDEVALVEAARDVGMVFEARPRRTENSRDVTEYVIRNPEGQEDCFRILHELPFDSDRKRMSVVVQHHEETWCFTKGADSVMEGLLQEPWPEAVNTDLLGFSRLGLRTLVMASRMIGREEYLGWKVRLNAAKNIIDGTREEQINAVHAALETGLHFVGASAVEDRLQDNVPQSIQMLKDMGIRVWVLTGDKTETAVEIARSCNLFDQQTKLAYVTKAEHASHAKSLFVQAGSDIAGHQNSGLVMDGQTLQFALESAECGKIAYGLGMASRTCVCTRLSPMQKMALVRLVQTHDKKAITLGIGDGANDVPMIHRAHLGVAVRGKEGTQAVQASDVAISQFRFVVPLLACHGRRAYRRVATFLMFYLYKNLALLIADAIWLVQDKFGADIAYPEYLSIFFNVVYSAWHLVVVLGFDQDVPDDVSLSSPDLYAAGPLRETLNLYAFGRWVLLACYHGAVMWVLPTQIIAEGVDLVEVYEKDTPSIFWVASVASLSCLNVIVNLRLVLICESPFKLTTILPTLVSWAMYFGYLFFLGNTSIGHSTQPCMEGVPQQTFATSNNALQASLLTVVVALSVDVTAVIIGHYVYPSRLSKARRRVAATKNGAPH